ncbi:hypothetical protein [Nonomuraea insulae]|uniref:Uncharacterized protein n=1 Tax=Nonomuraea insulae TaxID=1616787 RepID=A0ABW1CQW5_9ACTN
MVIAASLIALGTISCSVYFIFFHAPKINLGPLDVQYGQRMMEGTFADIAVPEGASGRNFLTLRFAVQNPSGFGSCITPARVDFIPIVDRIPRGEKTVWRKQPGEEVRLQIGPAKKEVRIRAVLHEADLACRVDLVVTEAILHD